MSEFPRFSDFFEKSKIFQVKKNFFSKNFFQNFFFFFFLVWNMKKLFCRVTGYGSPYVYANFFHLYLVLFAKKKNAKLWAKKKKQTKK